MKFEQKHYKIGTIAKIGHQIYTITHIDGEKCKVLLKDNGESYPYDLDSFIHPETKWIVIYCNNFTHLPEWF